MVPGPRRKKLAALARRMAKLVQEQPIPVDDLLLDCFDHVIADDELELLCALGEEPRTREEAMERAGIAAAQFAPLLARMEKKELVTLSRDADRPERIALTPFLPGWFESQLMGGEETEWHREFARRIDRLFASFRDQNSLPARLYLSLYYRLRTRPFQSIAAIAAPTRTVRVDRDIAAPPFEIHPTRTIHALIEKHGADGNIALAYCFCRQWRKLVGQGCRFHLPHEACLLIGSVAKRGVEQGLARPIGKDGALAVVAAAQKGGAIHNVFHERDDARGPEIAICNCCWDCCGSFGSYNRGAAALFFRCFFVAERVADAECRECGACVEHCPVAAIAVGDGGAVAIAEGRCIGCGQCAYQCPHGCLSLRASEREVFLPMLKPSRARIVRPVK